MRLLNFIGILCKETLSFESNKFINQSNQKLISQKLCNKIINITLSGAKANYIPASI